MNKRIFQLAVRMNNSQDIHLQFVEVVSENIDSSIMDAVRAYEITYPTQRVITVKALDTGYTYEAHP